MRIYTRRGDKGETEIIGRRVGKEEEVVESYGSVDELNAFLGWVRSLSKERGEKEVVERIQRDLLVIGAELAGDRTHKIKREDIRYLEKEIDKRERKLPPLHAFILPGGDEIASAFHIARTVCRRAERRVVALSKKKAINKNIIAYLNRLSDLLFIMARYHNFKEGVREEEWKG